MSTSRAARDRLFYLVEAALLLLLVILFAALPVDCASRFGGWIGRFIGPRLGISRRALRNLARAMPENDAARNRRILRDMWDNLGRAIAEHPHLARICDPTSDRVEIVNAAAIDQLMASGGPALLFGGHFANWEVTASTAHRVMAARCFRFIAPPTTPGSTACCGGG
jgi:Kdo2-lipid IVA lauroyltransferase/acyltransferase